MTPRAYFLTLSVYRRFTEDTIAHLSTYAKLVKKLNKLVIFSEDSDISPSVDEKHAEVLPVFTAKTLYVNSEIGLNVRALPDVAGTKLGTIPMETDEIPYLVPAMRSREFRFVSVADRSTK